MTTETTERLLITKGVDNDWFFTGDLRAGKRLALRDRSNRIRMEETETGPLYIVELSTDGIGIDEWGSSVEDFVEAWRFALGAYFGPADEPHIESGLAEELATVAGPLM